ncbi:MAG: CHASE2 domain-containing protein [Fibrobacteres bacterium]|nr:CHASE2 domain-containing protein [Fibrobacterota bacterium]
MKWVRLLSIIAGIIILQIKLPDLFREYDALLQNTFYSIRGTIKADERIVIVAIDDAAINVYGDWPWSRSQIADLLDSVSISNTKATYLNIFFRKRPSDTCNEKLAESLKRAGNVVIPFNFEKLKSSESVTVVEAPSPYVQQTALNCPDRTIASDIIQAGILHEPESLFTVSVAALGFNNNLSSYGVTRYTLQTVNYGNNYYPSVSLALAALYHGVKCSDLTLIQNESIYYPEKIHLAIDNYATSMINFCGPEKSFTYVTASEVLSKNFNRDILKDKIVLIGLTDKKNADYQRTPYSSKLSSTELWATITANTLDAPPFINFNLILLTLILPILVIIGVAFLTEFAIQLPFNKGLMITAIGLGVLVVASLIIFIIGYWISLLLPILYLLGLSGWLIYKRIRYGKPEVIKMDNIEYSAEGALKKIGRYEILKELGSGSMGTVYKAIDPKIHRTVAIKIIRLGGALNSQKELKERFLREARAAGGLTHPSIVTIYDFGETNSLAYMVMEYLEGESLEERLAREKRIPPSEVIRIVNNVADALKKAHDQEIIHRDIKPSNIMITKTSNEIKLMDFGIAKVSGTYTETGKTLGTPFYMSPEQINGELIDSRSDLFSLAVTAYECLTGERPFLGENLSALTYSILHKNPAPLSGKLPEMSSDTDEVFFKALSKDKEARYQTAAQFARELTTALSK